MEKVVTDQEHAGRYESANKLPDWDVRRTLKSHGKRFVAGFRSRQSACLLQTPTAGVVLGSVIPFTLIVILPTNKQLLNPALDKHSAETGSYLLAGAD
jgi:hypothetical protein